MTKAQKQLALVTFADRRMGCAGCSRVGVLVDTEQGEIITDGGTLVVDVPDDELYLLADARTGMPYCYDCTVTDEPCPCCGRGPGCNCNWSLADHERGECLEHGGLEYGGRR